MKCPYRVNTTKIIWMKNVRGEPVEEEHTGFEDCYGKICPFYSDGTGDYVEGVCIRAEKEKEE